MTHTIQVDRFSISIYHGVAAVIFDKGCFTVPSLDERNPKVLVKMIRQSAREAQVARYLTRSEIKKIASALSTMYTGED